MQFLPLSEDGTLDAQWLSEKLGQSVESAKVRGMDTMGGMAGSFNLLDVVLKNDSSNKDTPASGASGTDANVGAAEKAEDAEPTTTTLVIKTIPEANLQTSVTMNLWREANFYNELAAKLPEGLVPRVWFAKGDPETGQKVVIMENLDTHIPAGVFFGPGNPNNWGLASQLEAMVAAAGGQTGPEVADAIFKLHARLHAQFWQSPETEDLLKIDWLQGANWLQGNGREKWEAQQAMLKGHYDRMLAKVEAGESPVEYGEHLLACLKHAFAAVSWETFQEEIAARPWTVCQGDCHPGNALWPASPDCTRGVALIDFEAVALGSGAQDLGQFVISHMAPDVRRGCEKELVETYHAELVAALKARGLEEAANAYTFDRAWAEYVAGGAGRWAFFVPLLTAMCPPKMNEYFRDQLAAFLDDHVKDPSTCGMPRV